MTARHLLSTPALGNAFQPVGTRDGAGHDPVELRRDRCSSTGLLGYEVWRLSASFSEGSRSSGREWDEATK